MEDLSGIPRMAADAPESVGLTRAARVDEALRQSADILKLLMAPGGRFPSQRRLKAAWRLLQQLGYD